MRYLMSALALAILVAPVYAGDLCQANPFTALQAQQGREDYESSCGLCHLYNLKGRVPGNSRNEWPDIRLLNADYLKTLDGNGGMTPPLLGEAFFRKWKDVRVFADRISSAIGAFPPKHYVKPASDARIAAYILYKNCGRL